MVWRKILKGTDQGKRESDEMSSGFHPVYMVEFLFNEKPDVNRLVLQEALINRTGQGRLDLKQGEKEEETQEMLVFYHMAHKVAFQEGSIPAQTCFLPVHEMVERSRFAGALQQAWHWPEAGQALASARYSLRIHDMFTAAMPRKQRLTCSRKRCWLCWTH